MKNIFLYLSITVICLFLGCKKDKDITPDVVSIGDSFIKSISVNGAKELKLDQDKGIIQVVLPEGYAESKLNLKLDLPEGNKVELFPDGASSPANLIEYSFRGASPLLFTVTKKNAQTNNVKQYTVFVKHEGKLTANLVSEPVFYTSGGEILVNAEFVLTSGIGSVPETPNGPIEFTSSLIDVVHGQTSEGTGHAANNTIIIYQGSKFLKSDRLILSISYGDKKFEFPEIKQIKRSRIEGIINPYTKFLKTIPKNKLLEIDGGIFLPENNYKVEVSNDRMPNPRTFAATFASYGTLTFKLPDDLPDDHYLFNLYEGTTLISKFIEPVATDSAGRSVGAVWTEFAECPTLTFLEGKYAGKIVLNKGQTFYAMPLPGIMDGKYGGGMDPNKPLPALELRSGSETLRLQPAVKADWCYGDGGIFLYYGLFKIPTNASSGKYEARFVFKDNALSMPYWSQIEIR